MLKPNHCKDCHTRDRCVEMCCELRQDLFRKGGGRRKKIELVFEAQLDPSQLVRWNNRLYGAGGDSE